MRDKEQDTRPLERPVPAVVVQFAELEDMLAELELYAVGERLQEVRLWTGSGATGRIDYPYTRWHMISLQAWIPEKQLILTVSVVVATVEELHGRPFGPRAAARHSWVQENMDIAEQRLRRVLAERLPGLAVRHGSIHTGLDMTTTRRSYWEGLGDLYAELGGLNG